MKKEEKNYIKKSIEVHLNLLDNNWDKILIENENLRDKLQESLKHLHRVYDILQNKELFEKKRHMYSKYIELKKQFSNETDPKKKKDLQVKMQKIYKYYLCLKEICNTLK